MLRQPVVMLLLLLLVLLLMLLLPVSQVVLLPTGGRVLLQQRFSEVEVRVIFCASERWGRIVAIGAASMLCC